MDCVSSEGPPLSPLHLTGIWEIIFRAGELPALPPYVAPGWSSAFSVILGEPACSFRLSSCLWSCWGIQPASLVSAWMSILETSWGKRWRKFSHFALLWALAPCPSETFLTSSCHGSTLRGDPQYHLLQQVQGLQKMRNVYTGRHNSVCLPWEGTHLCTFYVLCFFSPHPSWILKEKLSEIRSL